MAKSPTPIPAPPVKIHRGAPGSAPARQRTRRKKVNPFVLFLRGLARRLYFGIKTAFKFLLFVPVLVFMVAFSYNVDRSGLFQGALAPRRIVDLMLQGYDVTNFEQMDEREVVQLFAQDVPETPEAIGIGSSRVLQFNRENTGVESFFNMGVTGADVRDNMTSYYKMVTYGKAPKVLLWSIDPWVFYGSEAAFDARADADLYNEFLTKVLNVPTDYEEPDKVELWKALADPANGFSARLCQSLSQFAHTLRLPFFSPLSAFLHTKLFAKIPLRLSLHIHVMSISGKCTDCIPDTEYKTKK